MTVSEANTTADGDKPSDVTPNDHSANHAENNAAVIVLEDDGAVKFVPDGDAGTVDGAAVRNGPSSSTSADAVVSSPKTDKEEKEKKEKPKVVGFFELVMFFSLFVAFNEKCTWETIENIN